MRSFDLFDTLIARRCVSPLALYSLVEQRAGLPGLAQARSEQAHALWLKCQPFSTLDIYTHALAALGRPAAHAQALSELEYQVELQELLPVRRHLMELQPPDWVLSDMHHPPWLLSQLLSRAGSAVGALWPATLICSNRGKHDGQLWHDLRQQVGVLAHLGDNPGSDVAQAHAAGHQARLTTWTAPNAAEQRLGQLGAHSLARAARSARLRSVGAEGEPLAVLAEAMASLVFPVLSLGAMLLHDRMRQQKVPALVFCGRDGGVWQRVFAALYPQVPSSVLASSRAALVGGSPGYRDYVLAHLPAHAWLVDLCGSGASWGAFWQRFGLAAQPLQLLVGYAPAAHYGAPPVPVQALASGPAAAQGGYVLEALCEEAYPGLADAQWLGPANLPGALAGQTPAPASGWCGSARLIYQDSAHPPTTSPLAQPMQAVLQVALEELRLELDRAQDRFAAHDGQALLAELLAGLAPLAALVEQHSGFMARNRQMAQSLI
ncbi:MAG: hypothetical protein ACKVOO_04505 [Burkholderiaceae bacterium]